MNPEQLFCHNIDCPARGQTGKGNIVIHSQKEKRCQCTECRQTFATSKGTLFYRLRTDSQQVIWVIVLLANGCPVQAIVKAFGFDERTVRNWWQRAGVHCENGNNGFSVFQANAVGSRRKSIGRRAQKHGKARPLPPRSDLKQSTSGPRFLSLERDP